MNVIQTQTISCKILALLFIGVANLLVLESNAQGTNPNTLYYRLNLNVSIDEAWNLWTTNSGLKKYFAPDCNVNLKLGGSYEIFFFPNKPYGKKGTDSSMVLSFIPKKMLSVEWGVPRWFEARESATEPFKRTYLVLFFSEGNIPNTSVIDFYHLGFRQGSDWKAVMEYFDSPEGWQSIFKRLETFAKTKEATNWSSLEWTKAKN